MTAWSDQQIATGSKWLTQIRAALARAGVAVLLVTPTFLESDFIHEHELAPILKKAEGGGVQIVWIPVRACAFAKTPAHLSPDTINRLEQAAKSRCEEATRLCQQKRFLCAMYLYGYSVEMCLAAAYYRSAGFSPNSPIQRDTRERQMKYARTLRDVDNRPLMDSDPHPLIGWARFLQWRRRLSSQLSAEQVKRLRGPAQSRDGLQTLATRIAIQDQGRFPRTD